MKNNFITANLIVASAYYVGGHIGLLLAIPPSNAAAVWPAAGIALAALMISGNRVVPGIFIGGILIQTSSFLDASSTEKILASVSIGTVISVAAVIQAWVGANLVQRYIHTDDALLKERSIMSFCLLAGPISCIVSASISIATLWLAGILTVNDIPLAWCTWWIGDSVGVLAFSPIILCLYGNPRFVWKQRLVSVALPLCILSIIVFIFFDFSYKREMKSLEDIFKRNALQFTNELENNIESYLYTTKGLKEFFDSTNNVTSEEFSQYSKPKLARLPEIKAHEWIPRVLHEDRVGFESNLGTQIKFKTTQGLMLPSPEKYLYFPIQYIEPLSGNKNALGFDIRNTPSARKAAVEACSTNSLTMTEPIKLIQETQESFGIVFYAPVYKNDIFNNQYKGCKSLSGFAASVLRLDDVINNIHINLPDLKLSVSLKTNSHIFYNNVPKNKKSLNIPNQFQFHLNHKLQVANQEWEVSFYPTTNFITFYSSWAVWSVIVIGFLISGLSGMGLLMLTGRTLRTEEMIKHRTEELNNEIKERKIAEETLRESNERFKAAYEEASIGMAMVSIDHNIIEANAALCNMLGYSKDVLIGVNFKDITHSDDIELSVKQHNKLIAGNILNYHFEKRYIHKQGHVLWVLLSVSLVRDSESVPKYAIAQMQDITERKQIEEKLSYQAAHDVLTGLANRREFERRAERIINSNRHDLDEHALCFMDLDQFKVVNDTCGHMAGDEMLRQISVILQEVVRKRDTLARLGGDEFGVLMEHCALDDAHRVATSLQQAIQDYQFVWEDHVFNVGVSIGLVPISETTNSLSLLLRDADAACYVAKDKGRNRIHVHHPEDLETNLRHGEMQWVTRISQALDENRFCLYAQAIEPLDGNPNLHFELLLRMIDNKGETIPPGAFLPSAERYNLMSKIDYWVIEHAFDSLRKNPSFLEKIDFCSINLSGQSLTEPDMLEFIITQLSTSNIDGNKICFEITETAAISNLSTAMRFISTLIGQGCRFALDDFGSGLSSFAYLKNLPVDYLKIDGMFVKDIVDDEIDHAMVKSINEIGHVMGMKTIAEFVENDVIKGMLKEIGVNYVQGFGIGKPQPFEEIIKNTS